MSNPFEDIQVRLDRIESMMLDLKFPVEKTEKQKDLLTVEEAANFLSLSVPTIYSKVSKEELPFMKRSKRLYFSQKELTEYIKKGRNKTKDEILSEADTYLKK